MARLRAGSAGLAAGPGPGRGAWVCTLECLDRATPRALARALRLPGPVAVDDELRALVARDLPPRSARDAHGV